MQLLIAIKQPFRVWVSVASTASAFVAKSSSSIVEAHIIQYHYWMLERADLGKSQNCPTLKPRKERRFLSI